MSTTDGFEQMQKAAAEAMWKSDGYDLDADPNSSTSRDWRPVYMEHARVALAAVLPLLLDGALEMVKAPADLSDASDVDHAYALGRDDAGDRLTDFISAIIDNQAGNEVGSDAGSQTDNKATAPQSSRRNPIALLDICECGDYRRDHDETTGRCGLCLHTCVTFRLHHRAGWI